MTTFGELAREIAGDKAEVTVIASPKFNPHFIQPKPSDVRKVAKADAFVFAGLDLEAWVDPLLEAAGKPDLFRGAARNIDLSEGVPLVDVPERLDRSKGDLHAFGNPHYWTSPENARRMAATLARRLGEIDPANAPVYDANDKRFERKLDQKIAEWKSECSHCSGKEIVSYHQDIEYLADFLGLTVRMFVEPKPGIPPGPQHMAELESAMRERSVHVITMPTYYSRSAVETLAAKTGSKIAIIVQNVGEVPQAKDIWSYYDYNVGTLAEALK
jgi:zinc/manganese transport system substrate-binding protein